MAEWEKLRILGKGSSAIVYLAAMVAPQECIGNVVAVKSSMPLSIGSLMREENIMRSLIGCEEFIQCYFGQFTIEKGEFIYNLVMEFAPYGSLRDLIRKGPLLESEARIYTIMLLKGLSCIHQAGVVHCDLKPDNILLFPSSKNDAKYQLKIADFGLSKTKEEIINAESWNFKFRGTPLYMSPESVKGQIETSLDIWSLGCIVIEMITGLYVWRNPPTSKEMIPTIDEMMYKLAVLEEAPMIPNGVSEDCRDFLTKCFIKNPSQRWTASKLLHHPFLFSPYDSFRGYERFHMVNSSSSFFSYDCNWLSFKS
ncbi:mitogen-activated protein kinase kinase kinase 20-like [Gastrolobium bilobum]|uniref:mitogen-activated protein kinase kinase kinase 20-like n=1 Tax=Gastrolobium bilobum TaxID=150636 RepID=UPI002AB1EC18|nr:mitogen-activated protein kinase kinase kinase 20-like [Gastrolobium bilobum]